MNGYRARWAFLLALPAALGTTLVFAGVTRGRLLLVPLGAALVALSFWGLNRLNNRA